MADYADYEQWKATQEQAEALLESLKIPLTGEQFYNFYSVPWDPGLYVKFPVDHLLLPYAIKQGEEAKVSFGISDFAKNDDRRASTFMENNYLGSSRLSDTRRVGIIVGFREELLSVSPFK